MELNYFATMFMCILDPANGQLAYINAGPYALLHHRA